MARKKKGDPMPAEAEVEAKLRPVRLDLTPEVHRLLRLVSADEEMSMAAYARDAIEKHLIEEAKKRGIRV